MLKKLKENSENSCYRAVENIMSLFCCLTM